MTPPRSIRVGFQKGWGPPQGRGLLASDPRARTLCRVLVTYPQVRHIVPDRVSLDPDTPTRTVESVVRFLERQHWLVASVTVE
jgi:hypothetical protein